PSISYYYGGEIGVQLRDHAAFTDVEFTNAEFARVFSLQPSYGRFFENAEAEHSAVVSSGFAAQNFGAPHAALGETIRVQGKIYNIVGVLPPDFSFPAKTQVWVGDAADPGGNAGEDRSNRGAFNYRAVAKLRPGITLATAQAQLATIGARLSAAYPADNKDKSFVAVPLHEQLVGDVRPVLLLLAAAVGLVLLIACVNVANLQLARATTRFREMALRSALGASQWQVARQVLAQSLLLAIGGSIAGILIAVPLVHGLVGLAPAGLPRIQEIHLNGWVLAFTALLCLLATVLAGMIPAWHVLRLNLANSLKQDASRGLSGQGVARLRSALVISEVALTFMLAISAGLLARTLFHLTETNIGFSSDRLLVMDAHAPANDLQAEIQKTNEFESLFSQLGALPGVEKVAGVAGLPTGQSGSNGGYILEGSGKNFSAASNLPRADFSLASPDYFSTMGIPLLKGRAFAPSDKFDTPYVVIISESVAKQSFPGQDPIGKQIMPGLDLPIKWMTIVGVVGDVRQDSPASQPGPTLYMPIQQHPRFVEGNGLQVVMRTAVAPLSLMDSAQKIVHATDPEIATKFTTMDFMLQDSIATPRFRTILIGAFAVLGLLLAMLGVYSVMGYMVAQRTFEVGVRLTFGAVPGDIRNMIVRQALTLAVIGIGVGLLLSLVAVRAVSSMLFGVRAHDPITFAAASALLLLSAFAAAYVPARRASSVDPMKALRYE
ncbi:MAG: ABC transporter permease, partial [Acidobacteriaceae bacterium]